MAAARRWTTWALVASLALNLALVGLIAGAAFKGRPEPMPGITLWRYARALPEPYRHDLGQALRESRRDWIGPREALRGQRTALAAALTAEPFEPVKVADVLRHETDLTGELATRGTELLLAQIGRMSPEERAAYAQALLEDKRSRGRRREEERRRP
jgi:uncharacterized membrane protein